MRFLGLGISDDIERRETVMIGTNELTRTYPRKLAPVVVIPDERTVEVRGHSSAMGRYGDGRNGGASCEEMLS